MDIKFPKKGINIDQVESVDSIVKRFKTVPCHTVPSLRKHTRLWLLL